MRSLIIAFLFCTVLPGFARSAELTVMTHDSFSISKEVLAEFETHNRVTVRVLQAGDAGAALNQAILAKNSPLADIFYGVDNTFLSRALGADIFEPYTPVAMPTVPADLDLDPQHRLVPVDFGDVCLNYDRAWFAAKGITPPTRLEDLTRKEYAGLLVVQNPATSSPGLAFLLTTIGHFGEQEAFAYWKALRANGVLVVNGWKEAYWGQFTAASKGKRPIVLSYASSPAAEVYFGKTDTAPTAAVLSPGTGFRQIEFAGILRGTPHRALAEKFMDFVLSRRFQEDVPLQMFVYPTNAEATLPEVFVRHARQAEKPVALDPATIDARREEWITTWTQIMLN